MLAFRLSLWMRRNVFNFLFLVRMVTHTWLTDVLKRLPSWPEARLNELLPLSGFVFSD